MRFPELAVGLFLMCADAALAGPRAADCFIFLDGSGVVRSEVSASAPKSVRQLCDSLKIGVSDREPLANALTIPGARLSVNVLQARTYVLEAYLRLSVGNKVVNGDPITLNRTDGGPPEFSETSINRLAGHLLDRFPSMTKGSTP